MPPGFGFVQRWSAGRSYIHRRAAVYRARYRMSQVTDLMGLKRGCYCSNTFSVSQSSTAGPWRHAYPCHQAALNQQTDQESPLKLILHERREEGVVADSLVRHWPGPQPLSARLVHALCVEEIITFICWLFYIYISRILCSSSQSFLDQLIPFLW